MTLTLQVHRVESYEHAGGSVCESGERAAESRQGGQSEGGILLQAVYSGKVSLCRGCCFQPLKVQLKGLICYVGFKLLNI